MHLLAVIDSIPRSHGYAVAVSELLGDLDVLPETEVRGFAGEMGFTLSSTEKSFIFVPCLAPFYCRVNSFDLSAGGMVLWSSWLF